MTAIDRTAYPRPGEKLTREELDDRYSMSETDHAFIRATARGDAGRLTLAALLKARQDLGCFPAPLEVHIDTVAHLASQLALAGVPPVLSETTPEDDAPPLSCGGAGLSQSLDLCRSRRAVGDNNGDRGGRDDE